MTAEERASLIAAVLALDPVSLGGVRLRSGPQPLRDQWLKTLRELMPHSPPFRRVAPNISDRQLFGGLDLAATLIVGRPIAEAGLLAAADGGVVVLAMAERLSARTASCLQGAIDSGAVSVPREGVSLEHAARIAVVALDEGIGLDEGMPDSLAERLAFRIDFNEFNAHSRLRAWCDATAIQAARKRLSTVSLSSTLLTTLCKAADTLGVPSCRTALLTARTARCLAALANRRRVGEEDLALALQLVVAHRATAAPQSPSQPPPSQAPAPPESSESTAQREAADGGQLVERVIAATQAAIPQDLLEKLKSARISRPRQIGRSGAAQMSSQRGRPIGCRAGNPQREGRLNVLATLQAAVPWQRLRAKPRAGSQIRVEASDFRVTRYRQRTRSLIVFCIDASGSAALHRLAEAKGAVELMLADCYVRRDQVAVIGFRGQMSQTLLPATRSLVRAKLSLAGLPGGGATPLASGIEAALQMASQAARRGDSPSIVFLTDGRANIGFNGASGREAGSRDALRAAAALGAARIPALFIDTSLRPNPGAQQIAESMQARYLPLPSSDSRRILDAVKAGGFGRGGVRA